jgi:hypothetical protein
MVSQNRRFVPFSVFVLIDSAMSNTDPASQSGRASGVQVRRGGEAHVRAQAARATAREGAW